MKILIFGAGVLGSFYAARLHDAKQDVTLLARGQRYRELISHGVVLENFKSGVTTVSYPPIIDGMPEKDYYDLCVILVQNNQLPEALKTISSNKNIAAFLVMTNYMKGPGEILDYLDEKKVLLGHVNAGGERDGHIVKYMASQSMTMGELDGSRSERLKKIAAVFRAAGLPVDLSRNMDSWKRHHLAFLLPVCHAMYLCDTCNYKLAAHKDLVRKSLLGAKEAMQMLARNGYPVEPVKLKIMFSMPLSLLTVLFQKILATEIMDIGGARHVQNARSEIMKLSDDLLALADLWHEELPVLRELRNVN